MSGRSKRASGRPTIADVAKRAGVGAMTVSRALRQPDKVSAGLRGQIGTAIRELGYVPNRSARALAAARADIVGVLIPSLANNVFSEVVRGLYAGLGDSHLQIQLGNTHYSPDEEERLIRLFVYQRPAAIVVSGIDQTASARRLLAEAGCPVVQIMELSDDPIDLMVGFSQIDCGRVATEHLLAQGYRRIAFISAWLDPRAGRRLAGYQEVMARAGLADPSLVTTTSASTSVTQGRVLFREALSAAPDIDAFVCGNDDIALGVLFECNRAGLPVPERFGIVGFNDIEMMAVAYPTVTSVSTPRFEIGRRAMQQVCAALADEPIDNRVTDLGFDLRIRESSRRKI